MNRATSLRSISVAKSGKSFASDSEDEELDFETFENNMLELLRRFNCAVPVVFRKEYQSQYPLSKKSQSQKLPGKSRNKHASATQHTPETEIVKEELIEPDITLAIMATYDNLNRLTEIQMANFRHQTIPRVVMQFIGLIVSNFTQLNKFNIKNCRIDMYIVHELAKVLPQSTITEVCLDDCPIVRANYDELLDSKSCIKHLSLCRCRINDSVVERIASKLSYSQPAAEHLLALNLTSNEIGDLGAKYLALALRSNRHLRYLNLADNLIGDEGASFILKTLTEFPLTFEEDIERRPRYMSYMKKKRAIYLECIQKCIIKNEPSGTKTTPVLIQKKPVQVSKSKTSLKRTRAKSLSLTDENVPVKAEQMAKELVGTFVDPFCPAVLRFGDGHPCCMGNFTLCYLNIAYNDLTYLSVKQLLSVVEYQKMHRKIGTCGLVRVILEGNQLPAEGCTELKSINRILHTNSCFQGKLSDRSARRSITERRNV